MKEINLGKKLSFGVVGLSVMVFAIFCCYSGLVLGNEPLVLIRQDPAAETVTLYVHVKPIDSGLSIEAKLKSDTTSFEVKDFPAEKLKAFLDVTSESSNHKYEEIEPLLKRYGRKFFGPLQSFIRQCTEIEFVLADDTLVQYPFDLLFFHNKPLFIQKPVAFSFEETGPRQIDLKEISHALLISDETADPERAVLKVQQYFKNNTYKDINDVKPDDLKTAGPVDLLLISAHGHIFDDQDDYIEFGDDHLTADYLANLKPKLVYFDSCFTGASRDFIGLFRSNGVDFYVAPWVPNEAGNSSTKTMCLFFESLDLYGRPAYALYQTRCQLYEHFSKKGIKFIVFFRSFPFRVYRFTP